jgi:hypothetical protein
VDERAVRLAENESWFREVNERLELRTLTREDGPADWFHVVCECSDEECSERIPISVQEYERTRSDPRRFVVSPGHTNVSIEDVVAVNGAYAIVEKRGDAGRAARMEDARTNR